MSGSEYEAIVVGGGPGGAAAAYHLARRGRRVLVVDKARFPREKVCGDGLTPRAVRCLHAMGVNTTGPEWARAEGLRIVGAGVRLDLPWPALETLPDYGLVRTRRDFDALLLGRAREAGTEVWEETEVEGPLLDPRGVVVGARMRRLEPSADAANGASGNGSGARGRRRGRRRSEPIEVHAPVVIAADGAASRFGIALGGRRLDGRPMGVAARTYFRSPRASETYLESYLELWRGGDLLPGYGWIFPLPDGTVNVGLGLLNTSRHFQNVNYRDLLREWVASFPPEWEMTPDTQVGSIRGGPLPMGFNRRPVARPGAVLIGDAAGIVNPFNGEGIAYAMETGEMAAEVADDALAGGDPWMLRAYAERLRDAYEGYYIMGRVFVRLIGNATVMRTLTRHGLPRRRLMAFAFKILGNLTDPRDGAAADRVINALARAAPHLRAAVKGVR